MAVLETLPAIVRLAWLLLVLVADVARWLALTAYDLGVYLFAQLRARRARRSSA